MLLSFVLFTSIACIPCPEELCTDLGCLYQGCVVESCGTTSCNDGLLCYNSNSTCVEETFRPSGNPECQTLNMCLDDPCYTDDDCSPELYCFVKNKCS